MHIDWAIETFDTLPSTQSYLKENIAQYSEGSLIRAISQNSGYGRHGRIWEAGAGNLYFSFIVTPNCSSNHLGQLSLLSSLAIYETIRLFTPENLKSDIKIKWPNDILIDGKKCSGLIINTFLTSDGRNVEKAIIGIGINVNSSPLPYSTCLQIHKKGALKEGDVLQGFLSIFNDLYQDWKNLGFEDIKLRWEKASFEKDTKVTVKNGSELISGLYQCVDNNGAMVIICDDQNEQRVIHAGDVFVQA